MKRVVHLTSSHPRDDTRIFRKECKSLALDSYDVHLVVADGIEEEIRANVQIYGVAKASSKIRRMIFSSYQVFRKSMKLNGDIYHIHDPELIPYGILLRLLTRKVVIFDSHENIPAQILSKEYLNPVLRILVAYLFKLFEYLVFRFFHAVVAATPEIYDHLKYCNKRLVLVQNFPSQEEFLPDIETESIGKRYICYVGALTRIRGIEALVNAMNHVRSDVTLVLAGSFSDDSFREAVMAMKGWQRVIYKSQIPFHQVLEILKFSEAGIVVFQNKPNHLYSQPNKIFEYMCAGIPVIASDFPLWRSIISESKSGICVAPDNPYEIAAAIDKVIENRNWAIEMGKNGQNSVVERYNWDSQYTNLSDEYNALMR